MFRWKGEKESAHEKCNISLSRVPRAKASFIIPRNYILLAERTRARSLLCLYSPSTLRWKSNKIWAENYINDDPSAAKPFYYCSSNDTFLVDREPKTTASCLGECCKRLSSPKAEMKKVFEEFLIRRQSKRYKPESTQAFDDDACATAGGLVTVESLCKSRKAGNQIKGGEPLNLINHCEERKFPSLAFLLSNPQQYLIIKKQIENPRESRRLPLLGVSSAWGDGKVDKEGVAERERLEFLVVGCNGRTNVKA